MRKSKIEKIKAIEILDSRGFPTLQVTITTDDGFFGTASVPSGASTGEHEALELRDQDSTRYFGKGVKKAIAHIEKEIAPAFHGELVFDQEKLDRLMIEMDGTSNKSRLGANAILGVSLALAKAAAATQRVPLYRYLGKSPFILPIPMMNIINGGAHADNGLEIQEFMIRPLGEKSFAERVRCGAEIFHTLKSILKEKKLVTAVGDEGGFAPLLSSNEKALELIVDAIQKAGYHAQKEVTIALDCAASEFYENGKYNGRNFQQQAQYLKKLTEDYPIDSIEDGMAENDWEGWKLLTETLGKKIQLVGDDIFVTNTQFLKKGIEKGIANAILIKVNQIGTLTETIDCIDLAKAHGMATIISHRSGETEDTSIADLSVATSAGQIKTGSLCRSERVAKYNRLLTIESEIIGNQ